MFKGNKELLDTLRGLVVKLGGIQTAIVTTREADPALVDVLDKRLQDLELGHAKWQAECEATLMKAEGQFKAARNAEERTKTMVNHESGDGSVASEEEVFQAYRALGLGVSPGNAEASEAQEVQQMREPLEVDYKTQALRMKFS